MEMRDSRLSLMKKITDLTIQDKINVMSISYNFFNILNNTFNEPSKKFYYKDILYLLEKEFIEILEYKYVFHLLDVILLIITSVLLTNSYGSDIGKYDDCFGLKQNVTCHQRQYTMVLVERNCNFLGFAIWLLSFTKISLTIHDKMNKIKFFYHHRKNR